MKKIVCNNLSVMLLVQFILAISLLGCGPVIPSVESFPKERPSKPYRTITVNFTFDEVFEAVKETAIRVSFSVEGENKDKGYIFINKRFQAFAIYIKETSNKPKTRVDFLIKTPGGPGWDVEQKMRNFETELRKVLLTYED